MKPTNTKKKSRYRSHIPCAGTYPQIEQEVYERYLERSAVAMKINLRVGFQCPVIGFPCQSVEFDNLKIFYHRTYPSDLRGNPYFNFYIARPGADSSECIDWKAAGIKVRLFSMGKWGEPFSLLVASPGARVRIEYLFEGKQKTHILFFPFMEEPVPTQLLPWMPA